MKVLRIQMKALTASFRIPFSYVGVQLSLPVPSYSNLLGLISCCMGRNITPKETRIGFEFSVAGKNLDLERIVRWDYNPKKPGRAKLNVKGPTIRTREYLLYPILILYLTNLRFKKGFLRPNGIPTFGRSQDLAWIEDIREVEIIPTNSGFIGGTLIPFKYCQDRPIDGFLIRLPEYYDYDENLLRVAKNSELFIATNNEYGRLTEVNLGSNLFFINSEEKKKCIYLHEWL